MTTVVAVIESVEVKDTSRGDCWEAELSDGTSVATFDEEIGAALEELEGQPAKLDINVQKKGQYTNRYVNSVEEADDDEVEESKPKRNARSGKGRASGSSARSSAKADTSDKDEQIARSVAVHTFGRICAGATPAVVQKHADSGILERLQSFILTGENE